MISPIRLTINQLIILDFHYIDYINKNANQFYLYYTNQFYGRRYNLLIANLWWSSYFLKLCGYFLSNIISKRGKFLYIDSFGYSNLVSYFAIKSRQYFVNFSWIAGTFTNFKYFYPAVFTGKSKHFLFDKNLYEGVKFLHRIPNMICFISAFNNIVACHEVFRLGIVSVSLLENISINPLLISFPIFANNRSLSSVYFYLSYINSIILNGYLKELFKFNRIKLKKSLFAMKVDFLNYDISSKALIFELIFLVIFLLKKNSKFFYFFNRMKFFRYLFFKLNLKMYKFFLYNLNMISLIFFIDKSIKKFLIKFSKICLHIEKYYYKKINIKIINFFNLVLNFFILIWFKLKPYRRFDDEDFFYINLDYFKILYINYEDFEPIFLNKYFRSIKVLKYYYIKKNYTFILKRCYGALKRFKIKFFRYGYLFRSMRNLYSKFYFFLFFIIKNMLLRTLILNKNFFYYRKKKRKLNYKKLFYLKKKFINLDIKYDVFYKHNYNIFYHNKFIKKNIKKIKKNYRALFIFSKKNLFNYLIYKFWIRYHKQQYTSHYKSYPNKLFFNYNLFFNKYNNILIRKKKVIYNNKIYKKNNIIYDKFNINFVYKNILINKYLKLKNE
jgi:ribosomal protein S2